jgi:alcohol dehydrogenase (cytochrome c)
MRGIALVATTVALSFLGCAQAADAQTRPVFTTAQSQAGKAAYAQSCARCHGGNLDDGEFGPPLRGPAFQRRWAGRSLNELFSQIRSTMPPGQGGTLPDTTYAQLLADLLEANGMPPGATELPSDLSALSAIRMPGQRSGGDLRAAGPSGGLVEGVTLPAWPARANPLEHITPVSDTLLRKPNASDWLSWRRTHDDLGFSPLTQIRKDNVRRLRVAWSLALPPGPNEATPLVHDGVIFVHSYGDHLQALDAATGDELWQYSRNLPPGGVAVVQRNIALYGNKVYFATSDAHVVALDMKSGVVVWDQPVGDSKNTRITGGPLVANGRVMQGTQGREPGGQEIVGLDSETGKILWRFNTIAQPGTPLGNSWNDLPLEKRNGGSVWTAGSYDAEQNLAFFGPAPTYDTGPLRDLLPRAGVTNDALYTNTTVALDPQTGRLVWHYQHLPNDQWDFDWAFERQIIRLPVDGRMRKLILTAGKEAVYDALDAETGGYVFSIDLGLQNIITAIDPKTGAKAVDPKLIPSRAGKITVCPHAGGAKSWLPGSYDAGTHILYVPLVESCMDMIPVGEGERGVLSSGVRWALRPRSDSDGRYGRLEAINLETRKTAWVQRQRAPQTTGVLATAGGVVFAGALDRWFTAYDAASGSPLWKMRLSDVPNSAPITYSVNGKQYVAAVVGNGGAAAVTFPALVPEIPMSSARSSAIWAFELPD